MMRKTLLAAVLLIRCFITSAQASYMTCTEVPRLLGELTLVTCDTSNDVTVAEYRSKKPSSPYATDLDQRRVSVAISHNSDALMQRAGMKKIGGQLRLESTKLADIPESESILRRKVERKSQKHGKWSIYHEFVQYAAQANAPGYPMKCGTAIIERSESESKDVIIASECHDLSDKRFTKTLDDISSSRCFK